MNKSFEIYANYLAMKNANTRQRLMTSTVIMIAQRGKDKPILTFEKSWMRAGGNLHGDNFLCEILKRSEGESRISCPFEWKSSSGIIRVEQLLDGSWLVGEGNDPDFLLYLWKKGRGDCFDFLISKNELIELKDFYTKYGFDLMTIDIKLAEKKLNANPNAYKCMIL